MKMAKLLHITICCLLLTLGSKKNDWQRQKKNQGKLPCCHEDLLSLVIGWPLWTMVHYFVLFFCNWASTPTVSHYQLDSQCAQPKFEPVLLLLVVGFFLGVFFKAGFKCKWRKRKKKKTHRVLKRLAFVSQTLRKMCLAFYAQSLGF